MEVSRRKFLAYGALICGCSSVPKQATAVLPRRSLPDFFNNAKCTSVLGDSISHGAFAGNIARNGWVKLLGRALNGEYGTYSYGYTPYVKLGSGREYESNEIHSFTPLGDWERLARENADNFVSGIGYRSNLINSSLTFELPLFMSRALIHYIQRPDGASVDVLLNNKKVKTIDTKGLLDNFKCIDVDLVGNDSDRVEIRLVVSSDGVFDFNGISYLSSYQESVCNNYSYSGRRLRHITEDVIKNVCENSNCLVMALGHNDAHFTDDEYKTGVKRVIDHFIEYSNKNNVNVIVPDFVWSRDETNWVRVELERLAYETSGTYINLPAQLKKADGSPADSDHLINTLGMWVDSRHPNEAGNKWIFEKVTKAMNLSCQTKADALSLYDYNFPPKPQKTESNSSSGGSLSLLGLGSLAAIGFTKSIKERCNHCSKKFS